LKCPRSLSQAKKKEDATKDVPFEEAVTRRDTLDKKEDATIFVWHTILLITFERRLQSMGRVRDFG